MNAASRKIFLYLGSRGLAYIFYFALSVVFILSGKYTMQHSLGYSETQAAILSTGATTAYQLLTLLCFAHLCRRAA